jgi:DivIVA domain-containing protein
MSLSPDDVERKTFKERFKGYDMDEVDTFLDRVVVRLKELEQERDQLRKRLEEVQASAGESERLLQRTLVTAQKTADATVEEARAEADRALEAARAEAEQTLGDARAEAERLVTDARDEAIADREQQQAEAERLARVIDELKEFRDSYIEQLRAVIQEQLDRLQLSSGLPDVPPEIQDLAASVPEGEHEHSYALQPVVELASDEPAERSVLDTEAHEQAGTEWHRE